LHDNRALFSALNSGSPVVCCFVFDENILNRLQNKKDLRVAFIHRELHRLQSELNGFGAHLLVGYGAVSDVWSQWIQDFSRHSMEVTEVHTARDYEPYAQQRDQSMSDFFSNHLIKFKGVKDGVVLEKNEVLKKDGLPYTVFTPYSRKWKEVLRDEDVAAVNSVEALEEKKETFAALKNWQSPEIPTLHEMGFESVENLDVLIPSPTVKSEVLKQYSDQRDFPAVAGTSRLSVHLRFGTVGIRAALRLGMQNSDKWVMELIWRDFYQMIIYHFPHAAKNSFRPAYDRIPWSNDEVHFDAWREGKTGYPIVDAGMRELLATGFMHNRVRMVVASFLCKHLLIDWRWGEQHFAAHLLDYDLASNVGGWQWAAGSGCDAAPYFRVFNPTSQQQKFDAKSAYIKKWVPEFGTSEYPEPIVEHAVARVKAIATYKAALQKD
jgi:deoxyribodipyrimidine photo-lyase